MCVGSPGHIEMENKCLKFGWIFLFFGQQDMLAGSKWCQKGEGGDSNCKFVQNFRVCWQKRIGRIWILHPLHSTTHLLVQCRLFHKKFITRRSSVLLYGAKLDTEYLERELMLI
jgi:hypothetical protein